MLFLRLSECTTANTYYRLYNDYYYKDRRLSAYFFVRKATERDGHIMEGQRIEKKIALNRKLIRMQLDVYDKGNN